MHCRCNGLINHITRSMVLTVMMTVCMMSSGHSRLLPIMLLLHVCGFVPCRELHSIHNTLSAASPYICGAIKAGRSLARNSAGSTRYTGVTTTYRSVRCMVCALV